MSARAALDRLEAAWDGARGEWARAREAWRDPVADRFERDFIDPMQDALPDVLDRLEELVRALEDARDVLD